MRASKFLSAAVFMVAVFSLSFGYAFAGPPEGSEGPRKVWVCHFEENHEALTPYGWDFNGGAAGFFTGGNTLDYWEAGYPSPEYFTGDYVVRYMPDGFNSGQMRLCSDNGGEFILVSVNSLGSDDDGHGHRAQNLVALLTYPDGWKG